MGILTPKSLKEYFWTKLNSSRSYSALKYEYINIRRVRNFSYYMVNDYPEISLLNDEPPKDHRKCEVSKQIVEETIIQLKEEGDHENCLLLMLISKYCLYPGILTLIRFEDFSTGSNGERFLNIFARGKMRHEMMHVDEETFKAVSELKNLRLGFKKQQYETKRNWGKGHKIKGYFIFPVQRCSIGRRLQNGFNGKIPGFSSSLSKIVSVWRRKEEIENRVSFV